MNKPAIFLSALLLLAGAGLFSGCDAVTSADRSGSPAVASTMPKFTSYTFDTGLGEANAEIPAHVPGTNLLLVTNGGSLSFLDISDLTDIKRAREDLDLSPYGEPTSVTVRPDGRVAAIAIRSEAPGVVLSISTAPDSLGHTIGKPVTVGHVPDALRFTPDGKMVIVAGEGEPIKKGNFPGTLAFISIAEDGTPALDTLLTLSDKTHPELASQSADGIEPEYVAISPDSRTAYVVCQENNLVLVADVPERNIADVWDLGVSDVRPAYTDSSKPLDQFQDFRGRREPDGIALTPDGKFLLTANEGDTSNTPGGVFSGSRDMAIWSVKDGSLVADTADQFERLAAREGYLNPKRADKRGVEPESVLAFDLNGKPWAAVTLERADCVALVDLSDIHKPQTAGLLPTGKAPEGITYIINRKLLICANEGDGTLTFIQFK